MLHKLIFLMKRRMNKGILYKRSVDEHRQAPPLSQRPGYQEATKALIEMQRQIATRFGKSIYSPNRGKATLGKSASILHCKKFLEWLSTNWAEYFAKERKPPTSSSSSQCSSTSWWSPHSWSSKLARMASTQVGRMTTGQGKGDRQHRVVFKKKSVLASGNWVNTASKRPVSSCYRQEPKDLTANLNYFFELRFASSQTQLTERGRGVYTEPTHRTRTQAHFSRCQHQSASSAVLFFFAFLSACTSTNTLFLVSICLQICTLLHEHLPSSHRHVAHIVHCTNASTLAQEIESPSKRTYASTPAVKRYRTRSGFPRGSAHRSWTSTYHSLSSKLPNCSRTQSRDRNLAVYSGADSLCPRAGDGETVAGSGEDLIPEQNAATD